MRINMDWLREWVDLDAPAQEIAELLTVAGLEVDAAEDAAPGLEAIVVGHVRAVERHPNADRLSLCRVFDGKDELEIVCGAPNVRAGINVPLAPVGAVLPGGLRIKAARIRGQQSNGMLCSARELGLSDDAAGLLILDVEAEPGTPIERHLRLPDQILDIDLTPNRGDCFSVLGIARELAARRDGVLRGPDLAPVAAASDVRHEPLLAAPADCPRFAARVIEGIRSDARSPDWMRERLRRAGLRPISPVVDVTNYVMWELGQPLHAYDAGKIQGQLRARRAAGGERLTLLDDSEIELADDVLVIADDSGPVGLAGIMGGATTAIDETSTAIVLEAAFFSQQIVQGRARRFGLHTDASVRFERGVDPEGQVRAIERATALLVAIAGGQPGPVTVAESAGDLPQRHAIRLRHARVERVLGTEVPVQDVAGWLGRLGMTVAEVEGGWDVRAPSHRFDIAIEEDLIEEVGRMMGYDTIEARPGLATVRLGSAGEGQVGTDEIADALVARGYDEIISYSFVDPEGLAAVAGEPDSPALVTLANPISRELSVMRSSLWPGLIRAAQQNLSRQRGRCRLFEIGTVFGTGPDAAETTRVAGIAVGSLEPEHWDGPDRDVDFYDVKSDVVALLAATGQYDSIELRSCEHRALGPSTATEVMLADRTIGYLGVLHPELDRRFDLRGGSVVFELDVPTAFNRPVAAYSPFSKFPYVRRDLAIVVDDAVNAGELTKLIERELGDHLYRAVVFDQYRGKALDSGRKSIGLGLILQDASRTLTDADADRMLGAAMRRLEREFGATIRT